MNKFELGGLVQVVNSGYYNVAGEDADGLTGLVGLVVEICEGMETLYDVHLPAKGYPLVFSAAELEAI